LQEVGEEVEKWNMSNISKSNNLSSYQMNLLIKCQNCNKAIIKNVLNVYKECDEIINP